MLFTPPIFPHFFFESRRSRFFRKVSKFLLYYKSSASEQLFEPSYCKSHTKHVSMFCGESTELWNVITDKHSNHCALNGYIITQTYFRRDCLWWTFDCRV